MINKLGQKTRLAFVWDLTGSFVKQISTIVVSLTLARLLSPQEFGLIGMALVFVSFSQIFVDVGFTQGLIQSNKNEGITYNSVFILNVVMGFLMSALIFFFAPFIEDYFWSENIGGPRLAEIVRWLSVIPVISAFGGVKGALLVRDLDFKALTLRKILSNFLGGVSGVVLALLGYGVYALVTQQLLTAIFLTSFLWLRRGWKPRLEFSYHEIKNLMSFSGYVFLNNLLRRFFLKLDTLFVGKYFSVEVLGYYSRAESLNSMITEYTSGSLGSVLFPYFSKIQGDSKLFESRYLEVIKISSFIVALITGTLYIISEPLILFLLGEKWRPSIPIFQVLSMRLLISPFGTLTHRILLAKGLSKQTFKVAQIRTIVLLLPIATGFYFGTIIAFTIALVLANFVALLISFLATNRYLGISFFTQLRLFLVPLVPIFILAPIHFFGLINGNALLFLIGFLTLQLIYSYIVRHEGMILTFNVFRKLR